MCEARESSVSLGRQPYSLDGRCAMRDDPEHLLPRQRDLYRLAELTPSPVVKR